MEEVVVAAAVSETTKCCFTKLLKCCFKGETDEPDADYHLEDNSTQYNLNCCSLARSNDNSDFHYVPSWRNSKNRNLQDYSKTVKQGVGKLETCL